ncbi:MAG: enoyl-CoA hydratase/isomerase family protein, partial [Sphingomonadaceae bacterium]|nr:enoyl-CoA hydratase/isomerase family protein [Sphingomonadaceae bacterium]
MSDIVQYEILENGVALVTLNRPEKRNAISPEMTQGLDEAIKRSEGDDKVCVVILTSSNDKVFCAGADLKIVSEGRSKELFTKDGGFAGFVEASRKKPWIAAVAGSALAGGMELSLACDMIVATQDAMFGLPEPKRGLLAAAGGVSRLPNVVPRNIAFEIITTGDPIDVGRAYELGLVNKVVANGEQVEGALALARSIAENAPLAVQGALALARKAPSLSDAEGMQAGADAIAVLRE